jgi:hypothetical protein
VASANDAPPRVTEPVPPGPAVTFATVRGV